MAITRQQIRRLERELREQKGSRLYICYCKSDGTIFLNGKFYRSEKEMRQKSGISENDKLMFFDYVFKDVGQN